MPRVRQESLDKLAEFIGSLPKDARNKCALCNETLTHLVKTAEVQTGAPTATVTRALANKINETAVPGDVVSGEALTQRVRYSEGLKCQNDIINKPQPEPDSLVKNEVETVGMGEVAMKFARMAVMDLTRIHHDHPDRKEALDYVLDWVKAHYTVIEKKTKKKGGKNV